MHKVKLLRSHYTEHKYFLWEIWEVFMKTFETTNNFLEHLLPAAPLKY